MTAPFDEPIRAVVAPFTVPIDWDPIYGTCSRCGGDAVLTETGSYHDGLSCDPRKAGGAEFLPDPM